jgi:A/G-specific adenine glycosylase
LLAGLYEFPSSENIEGSEMELLEIPQSILDDLLASPPPKYKPSQVAGTDKAKADSRLRITNIRHIGDTVHVFSHIKKTYRILWVILSGGSSPPAFSSGPQPETKKRRVDKMSASAVGARVKWVPEKEVTNAKCVRPACFHFFHAEILL